MTTDGSCRRGGIGGAEGGVIARLLVDAERNGGVRSTQTYARAALYQVGRSGSDVCRFLEE